VIRQIVRTWSNTNREGGPLLKAPAARKTAGPAAPQGIRIASASLATRSVQRHEEDRNELRPPRTEDASGTSEGRIEAREEAKTAIFRHDLFGSAVIPQRTIDRDFRHARGWGTVRLV
jgi:hypothetical protein